MYLFTLNHTNMSCPAELIRGIQIPSAAIAGVGTTIDLSSLFPANAAETFDEITVTNDADRTVKVEYTNDATAKSDFFLVPHGGKSFTHKLAKGSIATSSLKVYSISGVTLATGNITINLSKTRS
jgi:hypothetical protein